MESEAHHKYSKLLKQNLNDSIKKTRVGVF